MEVRGPRGPYTNTWRQALDVPAMPKVQAPQPQARTTEWLFYVCKVPLTKEQVSEFLGRAEGLLTADPLVDKEGSPKGYGYARYMSGEHCAQAIASLNGAEYQDGIALQLRASPGPPALKPREPVASVSQAPSAPVPVTTPRTTQVAAAQATANQAATTQARAAQAAAAQAAAAQAAAAQAAAAQAAAAAPVIHEAFDRPNVLVDTPTAESEMAGASVAEALVQLVLHGPANDAEALQELLDAKADPNSRDTAGSTCLMIACITQKIKYVELLLQYGAQVELQSKSGMTAVMAAIDQNFKDGIELLLSRSILGDSPGDNVNLFGFQAPTPSLEKPSQPSGPRVSYGPTAAPKYAQPTDAPVAATWSSDAQPHSSATPLVTSPAPVVPAVTAAAAERLARLKEKQQQEVQLAQKQAAVGQLNQPGISMQPSHHHQQHHQHAQGLQQYKQSPHQQQHHHQHQLPHHHHHLQHQHSHHHSHNLPRQLQPHPEEMYSQGEPHGFPQDSPASPHYHQHHLHQQHSHQPVQFHQHQQQHHLQHNQHRQQPQQQPLHPHQHQQQQQQWRGPPQGTTPQWGASQAQGWETAQQATQETMQPRPKAQPAFNQPKASAPINPYAAPSQLAQPNPMAVAASGTAMGSTAPVVPIAAVNAGQPVHQPPAPKPQPTTQSIWQSKMPSHPMEDRARPPSSQPPPVQAGNPPSMSRGQSAADIPLEDIKKQLMQQFQLHMAKQEQETPDGGEPQEARGGPRWQEKDGRPPQYGRFGNQEADMKEGEQGWQDRRISQLHTPSPTMATPAPAVAGVDASQKQRMEQAQHWRQQLEQQHQHQQQLQHRQQPPHQLRHESKQPLPPYFQQQQPPSSAGQSSPSPPPPYASHSAQQAPPLESHAVPARSPVANSAWQPAPPKYQQPSSTAPSAPSQPYPAAPSPHTAAYQSSATYSQPPPPPEPPAAPTPSAQVDVVQERFEELKQQWAMKFRGGATPPGSHGAQNLGQGRALSGAGRQAVVLTEVMNVDSADNRLWGNCVVTTSPYEKARTFVLEVDNVRPWTLELVAPPPAILNASLHFEVQAVVYNPYNWDMEVKEKGSAEPRTVLKIAFAESELLAQAVAFLSTFCPQITQTILPKLQPTQSVTAPAPSAAQPPAPAHPQQPATQQATGGTAPSTPAWQAAYPSDPYSAQPTAPAGAWAGNPTGQATPAAAQPESWQSSSYAPPTGQQQQHPSALPHTYDSSAANPPPPPAPVTAPAAAYTPAPPPPPAAQTQPPPPSVPPPPVPSPATAVPSSTGTADNWTSSGATPAPGSAEHKAAWEQYYAWYASYYGVPYWSASGTHTAPATPAAAPPPPAAAAPVPPATPAPPAPPAASPAPGYPPQPTSAPAHQYANPYAGYGAPAAAATPQQPPAPSQPPPPSYPYPATAVAPTPPAPSASAPSQYATQSYDYGTAYPGTANAWPATGNTAATSYPSDPNVEPVAKRMKLDNVSSSIESYITAKFAARQGKS